MKKILLSCLFLYIGAFYAEQVTIYTSQNALNEDILENKIHNLLQKILRVSKRSTTKKVTKSKWLFFIYAAARNDLEPFFWNNLEQMKKIGSNSNCTIVIHLDLYRKGGKKITKRLIVRKGYVEQIGPDLSLDSGDENTVITELRWINNNFEFDKLAVDFWNHGSGDLNPIGKTSFNPAGLFYYNPESKLFELDRTINFLDFVNNMMANTNENQRGVCFDDSTGNYLDDKKLITALNTFCMYDRKGKKIDVVLFDACMMAGIGMECIINNFAHYIVASEEVELGLGYPYDLILAPFTKKDLQPAELAKHVVSSYSTAYTRVTGDYTHSAVDLSQFPNLNHNVDAVSTLLIQALQQQINNSVTNYISQCANATTKFEEPTYVDLKDLYINLLQKIDTIQLRSAQQRATLITSLTQTLKQGIDIISTMVIANASGRNLPHAYGISIYLPTYKIYPSYGDTQFAKTNSWYSFLQTYLAS